MTIHHNIAFFLEPSIQQRLIEYCEMINEAPEVFVNEIVSQYLSSGKSSEKSSEEIVADLGVGHNED